MTDPRIAPLDAPFGAEVHGFVPSADPDDATLARLRSALDDEGLLVFRQVDLDFPAQQWLGELLVGAERSLVDGAKPDGEVVHEFLMTNEVEGPYVGVGKLLFHSDAMWSDDPFALLALYGVHVDPDATPTTFASAARAWATLPAALRARVDGLRVVHGEGQHTYEGDDYAAHPGELDRTHTTPIAMTHPRTGRTLLFVSEMQTREVVGLPRAESDELLVELRAHLYATDNRFDHRWHEGDLVVWDNLTVQHGRADVALHGPARTLRKTVVPPLWTWSVEYAV
jgi:taurine dioxygenase